MRRREFITFLGGTAAVASRFLPALAQNPSKRPLIAAHVGGSKTVIERYFGGFVYPLRPIQYTEKLSLKTGAGNATSI